MGRSLAFLAALLFFAIAPPSWFRSFTASGPARRRSTCTCADFCTTPARAVVPRCGRNPARSVGAPALRPRAPRGGTPDAARRSARGDAPLPPSGGGEAGEVGALCVTGGRRRRSGRPIPASGLGLVAADVTADVAAPNRGP